MALQNAWLVIDSGGTKTHMLLTDTSGKALSDAHCKGIGAAADSLDDLADEFVDSILKIAHGYQVNRIAANLGGKNENQLYKQLKKIFPNADIHVFRESSGVLARQLARKYQADTVLLMGTGIIAHTHGPKGIIITDGWGCNIGDAGSGYWIGLEAIKRSLLALEGEEPISSLAKEVTGFEEPFSSSDDAESLMLNRDKARNHMGWPLDRAGIAAYARVASRCALDGDPAAIQIFEDAGRAAAGCAVRGIRKAGVARPPHVLVVGGLANVQSLWKDSFEAALKEAFPDASLQIENTDLIQGALEYLIETEEKDHA